MNVIELLKYIFLGIVQGFTEPLPISSSGHLVIFQELLGMNLPGINFEIIVNTGSLIAIIIIFYKDIYNLVVRSFLYLFKNKKEYKYEFKYVLLLIIAVIPAGIIGLLLKDFIDSALKNIITVGISLLITSIALSLVNTQSTENKIEELGFIDALVIGLFQVFALIPGISRSGSTMVGGLSRKISFTETMRFSFLLYIPISIAATFLGLKDLSETDPFILGYISAFIVSVISTYFAVKWLFKVVKKGNLKYFSIYCLIMGITVLLVNFVLGVV